MTKPKSSTLSGMPKEQKCSFLIGPVSSWFMPNSIDLWTQPNDRNEADTISYFVYGSIGCFCLGEIHRNHHQAENGTTNPMKNNGGLGQSEPYRIGGVVNHMADVKNDNSRVACTRFQKSLAYPLVLVLTESNTLLIYDCLQRTNLVLLRKAEILKRFVGIQDDEQQGGSGEEKKSKRARFNITQQVNSCTWPDPRNIFLGVSLLCEKTCLLVRLKLNDLGQFRDTLQQSDCQAKSEIVASSQKIDLQLDDFTSPICLIESRMIDEKICLIAVALDDGSIIVIKMNLEEDKVLRNIKLKRHTNQICSMSLCAGDKRRYPLGLLASSSRDGLVVVWDLENMFYFADHLAVPINKSGSGAKINWFTLRFLALADPKSTYLAVSNIESGITLLKVPDKAMSKITMTEKKIKSKQSHNEPATLKHNALKFNIEFDPITQTLISTSLDGNLIIWSPSYQMQNNTQLVEMKQRFLIPALPDNARAHMLRHNPINESLLCLALGRVGLRFYSISNKLLNSRYDMSPSCSFVARNMLRENSSPTSVAWHPQHEYRLAIGTLEGKVYRIDITPRKSTTIEAEFQLDNVRHDKSKGKLTGQLDDDVLGVDYQPIDRDGTSENMKIPDQSKTGGIYSLCWGPNPASPSDPSKHAIYAVGSVSYRLFVFCSRTNNKDKVERVTNYLDEFGDTSLPEAMGQASEVAWKSSMDLMALGTIDGRVIILTYLDESHQERSNHKLFKHLATIRGHLGTSSVQCIAWHPTADKEDPSYYKIAASSNESPALVFNLKEAILVAEVKDQLRLEQLNGASDAGDNNDTSSSPVQLENIIGSYTNKLKAHVKAITDIAWNPHESNQLATCSFDRTCYVWSIDTSLLDARVIAKFSARDRLFTLDWSLNDDDLIFISGHDSVVWAWRPSENPHHLISV